MELPQEIQEILEIKVNNIKSKYLNNIFEDLSRDYIENTGSGKEFLKNKDYVLVYALSRMNATFSVIDFVLNKFDKYINEEINTIIDIGAGMGTASINSLYHFNVNKIDLLERNQEMINLGKELLDLYDVNYEYIKGDIRNFNIQNKYDMVISSYCLSELEEKTRINTAKKLWNMTDKYLIITDIGTPKGYKNMQEIKQELIKNGAKLLLPCPTNKCPIKDDWCHFATRINRSKINKLVKNADSPFEDEKFCYMVFGREGNNYTKNVVLRHPIIEKNSVSLNICQNGEIKDLKITKNNSLYKSARKIKVGDEL